MMIERCTNNRPILRMTHVFLLQPVKNLNIQIAEERYTTRAHRSENIETVDKWKSRS
jgi:hypothetical protein